MTRAEPVPLELDWDIQWWEGFDFEEATRTHPMTEEEIKIWDKENEDVEV